MTSRARNAKLASRICLDGRCTGEESFMPTRNALRQHAQPNGETIRLVRRLPENASQQTAPDPLDPLRVVTASIAHEVNQPLTGIITNASTCLRMLSADPPNIKGALETARRTIRDGHRASDVITRLRALFTKKDTTTESVDLNEAMSRSYRVVEKRTAKAPSHCANRIRRGPSASCGRSCATSAGRLELAAERLGGDEQRPRSAKARVD